MADAGLRFTKDDFDGDSRTVTWEVQDAAAAGGYAAWVTAMGTLYGEINKWSRGRDHRAERIEVIEDNGPGKSLSPIAQGNLRVICEGQDVVTGSIYRFPIPMPDLGKAASGGDEAWIAVGQGNDSLTLMNPEHADYATLKTAFEANVKSPNGNDVTFVRGYIEE